MSRPSELIERVISGANPDLIMSRIGLSEAKPKDAKDLAKKLASAMGGKVAGSRAGWGTSISGVGKDRVKEILSWLKNNRFENVSRDHVYRQLISHLGKNAWVFADKERGLTVRVADVDSIHTGGKERPTPNLTVDVLYS
jgi:hypothetical protein